MDSFYIAATGMRAHQEQIDSIARNVANVNTVGYKRETVAFATVVAQSGVAQSGVDGPLATDGVAGVSRSVGYGAVAQTHLSMASGDPRVTEDPLDLAIDGPGFVEVLREDGSPAFTRSLQLRLDADRRLVAAASGAALRADIVVPQEALELRIGRDGRVLAVLDTAGRTAELGQIPLVGFANAAGLRPVGDNLFVATPESGEVREGRATEEGLGAFRQGVVEGSNVKLVDELVALMLAQRAFEMNSRVVQAADRMLSTTNDLYRP
jgi:flagellar basal-body rod protein FlgG